MVYFPNKSETIFTRRKSKLYIFACWLLPLLVMTPSLTGAWGDHKLDYCARSCTIVDEENVKLKFKTFIYALGVVFPTSMLIYCIPLWVSGSGEPFSEENYLASPTLTSDL